MAKIANNIGQVIEPISVRRITKYVVKVCYKDYGSRYILESKLSDRLKRRLYA